MVNGGPASGAGSVRASLDQGRGEVERQLKGASAADCSACMGSEYLLLEGVHQDGRPGFLC